MVKPLVDAQAQHRGAFVIRRDRRDDTPPDAIALLIRRADAALSRTSHPGRHRVALA